MGGGRREADPRQGPRPTRPLSEGCGSPRSQSSPLPLYAFSWRGHMLVSPRVLSRRARPWGCLGERPEAASPPVYAERTLRQQVVIPASGSASATWSLAGPQRKPGAGGLRRNPAPAPLTQYVQRGTQSPHRGRKKERGLSHRTPPSPASITAPGETLRCCRGAASPARTPVPPAAEGALPARAGTCPVTTFSGSPDRPKSRTHGHHRLRGCEQPGEPRRPGERQESSETYSFPTACASRRGDVTGPSAREGQAAGRRRPGPRPQRAGGRHALPQRPRPAAEPWARAQAQTARVAAKTPGT